MLAVCNMFRRQPYHASQWLSTSAEMPHKQVAGHILLQHAAALHGIAACNRLQQDRTSCSPMETVTRHLSTLSQHYPKPRSLVPESLPETWQDRSGRMCQHSLHAPVIGLAACMRSTQPVQITTCKAITPRSMHSSSTSAAEGKQLLMEARAGQLSVSSTRQPSTAALTDSDSQPSLFTKMPIDMDAEERLAYLRHLCIEDMAWDPGPLTLQGSRRSTIRAVCPECGNGTHGDDCFAITVDTDESGLAAQLLWCCHRATCGNSGSLSIHRHVDSVHKALQKAAFTRMAPQPSIQPPAGHLPTTRVWQEQKLLLLRQSQAQPAPPAVQVPARSQGSELGGALQDLTPELLQWFEDRGISKATLERNQVKMEQRYCAPLKQRVDHMAFPYFKEGTIVNIKYRALPKHFSQTKGGQQVLYGYDDARGASELIIVEGEMDKLAVEEALRQVESLSMSPAGDATGATSAPTQPHTPASAGFLNPAGLKRAVVSVPAGAPARRSVEGAGLERKFKFLDECCDILDMAHSVLLAVDNDQPGLVLATELSRRIGQQKCRVVTWPTSRTATEQNAAAGDVTGPWARKDANEVLLKDGPHVLKACLDQAKPLPIKGLYPFQDFWQQVHELYMQGAQGLSWGVSTGWSSVDQYYRVVPGELTIVTGLPNSGKSEWLDALAVNLASMQGWSMAICSLENTPKEHGRKLMEKYTGKAFFDAEYAVGTSKMPFQEVMHALAWVDGHFHLISPPKHNNPCIDYILDKARAAVMRYGIRGLIIDPYNELDTRRSDSMLETEHVSRMLTKIKRFAQHFDCHVWFVAHPRTQRPGLTGGTAVSAPSMYDISGSAHFINKADNGIVIHRPYTGALASAEGRDTCQTQILVRKVRNKLAGKIGDINLSYDPATGRYQDLVTS